MSTQVQYRRGTSAENDAFTGALAEITVDTTNNTLRVHDGVTPGGFATALGSNPTFTGNISATGTITAANINGTSGVYGNLFYFSQYLANGANINATGYNAVTVGPVTVPNGDTVTVTSTLVVI